tara:strand:+ start:7013 stop:7201 length:189 start_codon:yes stop_codon:yes gene_type:complete
MKKYSEDMIREAIDIAIGDNGYRKNEVPYDVISDEVIGILEDLNKTRICIDGLDDYYMSLME